MDGHGGTNKSPWLTWLPLILGALSLVTYAVIIALEIGTMRGQITLAAGRIQALEERGSGPVQQSAERVAQIQTRVDRILTELLDMQKRLSDIAASQARDEEKMNRLSDDLKK
jgi:hypothetical protein